MSLVDDGVVYFIGNPQGVGFVKIGWSSNPVARLRNIELASPIEVAFLAWITAPYQVEYLFHARHAASHRYGEWFERSDALMADIQAIAERRFDLESLAASDRSFTKSSWWLPRDEWKRASAASAKMIEAGRAKEALDG